MVKSHRQVQPTVRQDRRSPALEPLISICLLELRGDFGRLLKSGWGESERKRARELITALLEASERNGLLPLAHVFRSLTGITSLSPEEARSLGSLLSQKLEELLRTAERFVTEQLRRQIA